MTRSSGDMYVCVFRKDVGERLLRIRRRVGSGNEMQFDDHCIRLEGRVSD